MTRSLHQLAEALDVRLIGDGNLVVRAVASIGSSTSADLVFVDDEKHIEAAVKSRAGAIIAGEFAAAPNSLPRKSAWL